MQIPTTKQCNVYQYDDFIDKSVDKSWKSAKNDKIALSKGT